MIKRLSRVFTRLAVSGAMLGLIAACGGDTVPSATLKVVPALGAVYNGDVTVYSSTGTLLGTGSTGATGTANVVLVGDTSGAIVVKLALTTTSSFFDESANGGAGAVTNVTTPFSMLSAAPSLSSEVGVTSLTNTAAALAGLDVTKVGTTSFALTADQANDGAARLLLALGLPTNFPVFSAPVPATATAPLPTDSYGLMLARLGANTDPLQQAKDMVAAVSTGSITTASVFNTIFADLKTVVAERPSLSTAIAVASTNNTAPTDEQLTTAKAAVASAFTSGAATGAIGATGATGSLSQ